MLKKLDPAMTVRDVAGYLNVDEKTIYRLAQRAELPGFKVASAWRFQRDVPQRWINHQKRFHAGTALARKRRKR